jgi:hypothetical protein
MSFLRIVTFHVSYFLDAEPNMAESVVQGVCMVDTIFILFVLAGPDAFQDFEGVDFIFNHGLLGLKMLFFFNGNMRYLSVEEVFFLHEAIHLLHEQLSAKTEADGLVFVDFVKLIDEVRP